MALLATVTTLALIGSAPQASAADPVVTVGPVTDLREGDPVSVTVEGVPEGHVVVAQQCADPMFGAPLCPNPSGYPEYPANARRLTWDGDRYVTSPALWAQRRYDSVGRARCASMPCSVRVTVDGVVVHEVPITFRSAPDVPYTDATMAFAPTTGLVDGQPVAGTLEHVVEGGGLRVRQCAGDSLEDHCAANASWDEGRWEGRVEVEVAVYRTFSTPSGPVDCMVRACTISALAIGNEGRVVAEVPLSFQAQGAYDWGTPTLEVERTTGLEEGSTVDVSGGGYHDLPGGPAYLQVCRAVPQPDPDRDCVTGQEDGAHPLLSLSGQVEVFGDREMWGEVDVFRHIQLPDGWYDCGLGACTMAMVQPERGVTSERVPISFGPDLAGWDEATGAFGFLVEPLYRRSLGAQERAALVASLADGSASVPGLAAGAAADPSVDRTIGEAVRQYRATFGRYPDAGGLEYWIDQLDDGLSLDRMARMFAGMAEGRATYAGLDAAETVAKVYEFTLHRAPDADGAAYWTARLEGGFPLWKLVSHFSRSAENRANTAEDVLTATVTMARGWAPDADMWAYGGTMWVVLSMHGW